jgi:hypothetical protein
MAVVTIDAAAQVAASSGATGWSARGTFEVPDLDVCQIARNTFTNVAAATSTVRAGQSFTTTSAFSLAAVRIVISRTLSPADNWSLDIYADSASAPTGASLATSDVIAGADISATAHWHEFVFASPPSLSSGTKYWIVLKRSGAVDASNYMVWYHSSGSVYGGGGRALDNAGVWGAESATADMTFETVKTTKSLYQVTQDTGGSPEFHMYKSTDNAASWSEVDTGNGPTVFNTAYPWSADWSKSGLNNTDEGNAIILAYFTNTATIRVRAFNIGAQTWATADLGAADATTAAINDRPIRILLTPLDQYLYYTNSTDDADLFYSRRSTSTWGTATAFGTANVADASTISDSVKDNSVYGGGLTATKFHTTFLYDAGTDGFKVETLSGTTQGTLTSIDAAAGTTEASYSSATYHVYDGAGGVDTVVAAYIDADDSLEERTAQLEVTSASITLGTQHAVGTSTSYAGRQLSTCKFGSDLYVFASLGTGIDYYKDTGASGTWGSVNNWKSGLTNCFLSQAIPLDGVGILVVYNDNGDVKCDIAEAVAGNVNVGGSLATATSAALSATIKAAYTGSLATATATANVGTVLITYRVTGSLATADAAALSGTIKAAITGSLATGSGAALSGSLKATVTGSLSTATSAAVSGALDLDLTGSVAGADGQAYAGSLGTGVAIDGSLATASAQSYSGTITVLIGGSLATGSGAALVGSLQIDIDGGNAVASGSANSATIKASYLGNVATADAAANPGSLEIDIAGLVATAAMEAFEGALAVGYTVLGSLATASATANAGTTGQDDGTSDDRYSFFQIRTLPTRAED